MSLDNITALVWIFVAGYALSVLQSIKGTSDFVKTEVQMKEVFEKAILTYGQTAQEDVAIEEMSELIKAICKMRRAGVNEKPAATDAIVDEIADVSIMLEQLCMMYECFDAVENRRQYKVRRLENRLK